jgi:hypothetical protein
LLVNLCFGKGPQGLAKNIGPQGALAKMGEHSCPRMARKNVFFPAIGANLTNHNFQRLARHGPGA